MPSISGRRSATGRRIERFSRRVADHRLRVLALVDRVDVVEKAAADHHDAAVARAEILLAAVGDPPCPTQVTKSWFMTWLVIQRPVRGSAIGPCQVGIAVLHIGLALVRHAAEMPGDAERVLVVDRHAELDVVAGEERVRPQADAADRPQPVVLAGVGADALVLEAVLELVEIDLDVVRRIGAGLALQPHAPVRMRPFEMHRVDRVLLALEPVARDLGDDDLAEAVLPGEELPIRHQRRRLRPEIGPEQPAPFRDRIGLDADLVLEPRLGMRHVLVGLREAASRLVIEPAVIVAAQPALLDIAVGEIGAAMPAMPVEEAVACRPGPCRGRGPRPSAAPAWCPGSVELAGAGDRPPVAAQQLAHRRSGAGLGQHVPAAARLVDPIWHRVLRHRRSPVVMLTDTVLLTRRACAHVPIRSSGSSNRSNGDICRTEVMTTTVWPVDRRSGKRRLPTAPLRLRRRHACRLPARTPRRSTSRRRAGDRDASAAGGRPWSRGRAALRGC